MNDCILPIIDTSIYADKVDVECAYLDVLPPGFSHAVRLDAAPGFCTWKITACDLGLQKLSCGDIFAELPDGVYAIKYSVKPNEYVFVEYNHLRITAAMNKLNNVLCAITGGNCDPTPKIKERLKEVRFIEMLLKAAKAKVEFCHTPKEGMDLYEYALKLLSKIDCTACI